MNFKIGSGADLTLITVENFEKLVLKLKIKPVKYQINSPRGKVPVIRKFIAKTTYREIPYQCNIIVAKVKSILLSRDVSEVMGLLRRSPGIDEVNGTVGLVKTEPTII